MGANLRGLTTQGPRLLNIKMIKTELQKLKHP